MNKFFFISIILISIIYMINVSLTDVLKFRPYIESGYPFLQNFGEKYPQVKNVGFVSDYVYPYDIIFKIQNTIMPVFVWNSDKYEYIFCFSEQNFCNSYIINNILVEKYSDNLYLFKSVKGNKT